MSPVLYPLDEAETLQRMKTRVPDAYRAVMDNIELGPQAAEALKTAPARCGLTELLVRECAHCQHTPDPAVEIARHGYEVAARQAGGVNA